MPAEEVGIMILLEGWLEYKRGGNIAACRTTGDVNGGGGNSDSVGGIVGAQPATTSISRIVACWATGTYQWRRERLIGSADSWAFNQITMPLSRLAISLGRLMEEQEILDLVGGISGFQGNGSITASYATGDVAGGAGNNDAGW